MTRTATAGTRSARTPRPRTCTPSKVGVGDLVRVYMGVGVDGLVRGGVGVESVVEVGMGGVGGTGGSTFSLFF